MAQILGAPVPSADISLTQPITECHCDCGQLVDECHAAIRQQLQDELAQSEQCILDCEATIQGQIHQHQQEVNKVLVNAYQKIIDAIQNAVNHNYADLSEWFPLVPTVDEMALMQQLQDAGVSREDILREMSPANIAVPFGQTVTIPGHGGLPPVQLQLPAPGEPLPIPVETPPLMPSCPVPETPAPSCPAPPVTINMPPCPPTFFIPVPGPGGQVTYIPLPPGATPTQLFPQPPIPPNIGQPPGPIPAPQIPQPEPPQVQTTYSIFQPPPGECNFKTSTPAVLQPFIDWCNIDVAKKLPDRLGATGDIKGQFQSMLGWGTDCTKCEIPFWVSPLLQALNEWDITKPIAKDIYGLLCGINSTMADWLSKIWPESECLSPQAINARVTQVVLGLLGKWISEAFNDIGTTVKYTANYYCPELLPDAGVVNAIARHGLFTDQKTDGLYSKTWEALVRANGYCPDWQKLVNGAMVWHPTTLDAARTDRTGFTDNMPMEIAWRRAQVWDDPDRKQIKWLTNWRPALENIVRQFQGFATDDGFAKKYGLDEGFNNLVQSDYNENLNFYGFNANDLRLQYRSSWSMPQGRIMVPWAWKFRSDSIDPVNQAVVQSKVQYRELMQASGIPDTLIDAEVNSRRPAVPIDSIKTLYDNGSMNATTVISLLKDHGYTDFAVQVIIDSWIAKQQPKGSPNKPKAKQQQADQIIKLYEQQAVGRAEALQVLISTGLDSESATELLNNADVILIANQRLGMMKTIKKRFMYGDITSNQALKELEQIDYDPPTANRMVVQWVWELTYRYKEATAGQLCQWFLRGLLDAATYKIRLVRIGYTNQDADRIILTCVTNAPKKVKATTQLPSLTEIPPVGTETGGNGSVSGAAPVLTVRRGKRRGRGTGGTAVP